VTAGRHSDPIGPQPISTRVDYLVRHISRVRSGLMASRSVRFSVVALMFLLITMSSCARNPGEPPLAKGCHPPAHEDRLLAAYRDDPVFAVKPPEALAIGTPTVEKGCREVGARNAIPRDQPAARDAGPGRTATQVSLFFALNVGFSQDQLTAMYDPGIRARGWAPEPLDMPPLYTGERQAGLYYCKQLNGVPSFLWVYERSVGTVDGRANVGVSPSPDGIWPEAGNLEVRITAIRGIRCAQS
jgi:hypothetical protein